MNMNCVNNPNCPCNQMGFVNKEAYKTVQRPLPEWLSRPVSREGGAIQAPVSIAAPAAAAAATPTQENNAGLLLPLGIALALFWWLS